MVQLAFDLAAGERCRDLGISLAALDKSTLLETARSAARLHARKHGTVSIDDVMIALHERGLNTSLGNCAGAVFRGNEWIFTGKWEKSARVSNHARMNRVWRLK